MPGQQVGHRGACRAGGVFGHGSQTHGRGNADNRRIRQRVHGHGDGVAVGLGGGTRDAQIVDHDRDGVGAGAGGIGVVGVRRVGEIGTAQSRIDVGDAALHRHAVAVVGTRGDRQSRGRNKIDLAMVRTQCDLLGAAAIGIAEGNARYGDRLVFVHALRTGHQQHRRHVDQIDRNVDAAGCAVRVRCIDGLEGDGGTAGPVRGRCERHVGGFGHRERCARRQGGAATVLLENAVGRNRDDLIARDVAGAVGVRACQRKGLATVLVHGNRRVDRDRWVVDRRDVDRHAVGRRIQIDAAVGRATVVLHLEAEVAIAVAIGVGHRRVNQLAAANIRGTDEVPCGHCRAVVGQAAMRWQRCDLDGQQAVGAGRVGCVGKAEFGRSEDVRIVFIDRDRVVGAAGCIVDRVDHDVEAAAVACHRRLRIVAIGLDFDRDRSRAIEVGCAIEFQAIQKGVDTRQAALPGQHGAKHPVVVQVTRARIGQRHHRFKQYLRTAVAHSPGAKAVGRILVDGRRWHAAQSRRIEQTSKPRHGVSGQRQRRLDRPGADFEQPVATERTGTGGVAGGSNVGAGQRRQLCDQCGTLGPGTDAAAIEQYVGVGCQVGGPALQCLAVIAQSRTADAVAAQHQRATATVADDLNRTQRPTGTLQCLRDGVQARISGLHQQHLRASRHPGQQTLVVCHPGVDHQER